MASIRIFCRYRTTGASSISELSSSLEPGWLVLSGGTPPETPLELWSFEASPFCRIARETLCELELPYLLHNVGKDGAGRAAFVARSGKMMVPYLADPNTGREMFESAEIRKYLNEMYSA